MTTLCLNMIVKDEAHVIRRCLDSVKPFIDHWVIVDTGSIDGTQDVIREHMKDIPGELFERSWKDFGHNRTEALKLAEGKADYVFVIDADEVFETPADFEVPELTQDEYMILHRIYGNTTFYLTQIVRDELNWRYEGVLHEYIICDEPHKRTTLEGPVTVGHFDSARNRQDPKTKYSNDASVLERALESDPDNTRYVFYLAQSYRDAGELHKAIQTYHRRADMDGWDEEIWYSLFQIGVLKEAAGIEEHFVVDAYLAAYQYRPGRAEPMHHLARFYRLRERFPLAHLFASQAVQTPQPDDGLFLDNAVYDWRCLDEYAIAAFYAGEIEEARKANQRLLSEGKVPESELPRIRKNLEFCETPEETGRS